MKIVFSTYDDINNPYYGGGGALAVHELAKRWIKDFDVLVVSGSYANAPKSETIEGVEYFRIGSRKMGPKLGQLIFQLSLPYYVLKLKYDVWIESFTPPFSTSFLPLFTSKPIIGCTYLLAGDAMAKKYHLPFNIIERLGLKIYKNIIVLTEKLKKQVLGINKNLNAAIIPIGISKYFIDAQVDKTDEFILYLGRIDINHKGIDLLLTAYKDFAQKSNIRLVMAGGGISKDMDYLTNWIKDNNLQDKIKYLGKVSRAEKMNLLHRSMFVVIPSRFEGFNTVALEAFSAASPVITFDIEDLEWIPKEYSIKVKPFDVKLLSEAMLNFTLHKSERMAAGNNAKEFSRKFDWDVIAIQYKEFINSVV